MLLPAIPYHQSAIPRAAYVVFHWEPFIYTLSVYSVGICNWIFVLCVHELCECVVGVLCLCVCLIRKFCCVSMLCIQWVSPCLYLSTLCSRLFVCSCHVYGVEWTCVGAVSVYTFLGLCSCCVSVPTALPAQGAVRLRCANPAWVPRRCVPGSLHLPAVSVPAAGLCPVRRAVCSPSVCPL